ncbi:cysteinyl-trna synthetase : Cysteine--tRNA ligase OS=Singulisphaera acidiphila (strain ATCC BAA-1392 / DSM 18658 / VKM B-2454 / MOB10) GN=cysS PE=3 SV=1: tRNA-synt_1e: DALR_2 [Gemmata massiliana]|uniref:Cysteine--tRNA ligase n=1 Tax=Gemmata massiliana TaxID=1210884 RepID=A0A6P2CNZ3_9BACT|nr:cysteine--tRNA ligase [Gemmata massiliana]VTR90728.1 cysteinyl-trna synthetase : Cysteine--tRNA ligase OS=Singulisphaera acidiphila (strain ATCC BAA-1392 / DSM 18658 / VKM B-2454 / MOB10) GN=cysS PE=3 SV=1: tRNA-synt_1e: DALR_2 [Gemmata massiliana]
MALQVYSTLTRKKEPFHKKPGDTVTMYVCGPTVYKPSHIGHMVGPVIFDTVKRYLTYLGYKVKWIVNITDVDDKLINRAKELNTTVPELSAKMTEDYFACLKSLNVTGIDHFPKATDHIGGMIEVIQALIKKDYAYEVDDGVYFDVAKDADYGKLSNRDPEQMEAGARLEPNPKKRNPGDFALWKSKPGEPKEVQFESPFKCGRGRPGWHIECTCMAIKELGETLDIHGGGLDLQFPHHENELAQSESWTDKPFAHFWMHNGLLKMGSAKMAGSVGNVVNIADLLKKHTAETVRFLLLSTHYRSPIEYSEERLDEIARSLQGFYRFFERYERYTGVNFYSIKAPETQEAFSKLYNRRTEGGNWFESFCGALDEDFNTGNAIGFLYQLLNELNRHADREGYEEHPEKRKGQQFVDFTEGGIALRTMGTILGLFWEPPAKQSLGEDSTLVSGLMQLLLDLRNNLRATAKEAAKDNPLKKPLFDQTDLIRKRLGELGVTLEDRPGGTTWRVG